MQTTLPKLNDMKFPSEFLKKLAILLAVPCSVYAQQIADTTYKPEIKNPVYEPGKGSVVFIDEGHHNFHTKSGRYRAFSDLLERDGYVVRAYGGAFRMSELEKGEILVISNALNEKNVEDWFLPTPSAFSKDEIKAVRKWVRNGGCLFLIADHMPMAGAAKELAAVFDFEFTNGFVVDTSTRGPAYFNLQDRTLAASAVTRGRDTTESVEEVVSFTGQGFKIPGNATPVLIFGENYVNLLPDTAWVFDKDTPALSAMGWSQGAYKKYGKGKVAAFGEAAMFTAQLAGPNRIKMGMNNEVAPENYQLLLNIIHWLDGMLE